MNLKELICNLFEEEESGRLFDWKDYRFSIHSPEGPIPHIHFTKGNPRCPELKDCLGILFKGYTNHGSYKDILNKKVFDIFCNWMSEDENFNFVCDEWNKTNSIKKIEAGVNNPYKK